jgi:hypothetical protein
VGFDFQLSGAGGLRGALGLGLAAAFLRQDGRRRAGHQQHGECGK